MFLATGSNFPDALSAAPAATNLDAPILLTTPTCAPAAVIAEVARLGANRVIVLGGTNTVSNAAAALTPCQVLEISLGWSAVACVQAPLPKRSRGGGPGWRPIPDVPSGDASGDPPGRAAACRS